ncbi:NAD(P)-binding protein, partial [Basidiobolus meristosporus CBS 931.73]
VAGSGGVGSFIVDALIRHHYRVVVLTRSSESKIPGAKVVSIDYSNHSELVEVLRGVDAVVSAISGTAILEGQLPLIDAALEAGVQWFLPSEYGIDIRTREGIRSEFPYYNEAIITTKDRIRDKLVQHQETMAWTFLNPGFFIDIALSPEIGFDLANKKAVIVGDGNALVSWSTRYDAGEYVAAILANQDTRNQEVTLAADLKSLNDVISDIESILKIKLSVTHLTTEE